MRSSRRLSYSLTAAYLALLVPQAFTQSGQTKEEKTFVEQVEVLLRRNRVGGGLEFISGCSPVVIPATATKATGIKGVLQDATQTHKEISWRASGKAYIVTIRQDPSASILALQLPPIRLKATNLTGAVDALLSQPVVAGRIHEMGFTQRSPNLGPLSVNEHSERTLELAAGTLGDDLTRVGATFGTAIWKSEQKVCAGHRTFMVDWISK